MRSTKQLSITLPTEMADLVRQKVESGDYASESEVIRDGLRALQARDRALESWLREEVAPAYDAMKAGVAKGSSGEEVRQSLKTRHRERTAIAGKQPRLRAKKPQGK